MRNVLEKLKRMDNYGQKISMKILEKRMISGKNVVFRYPKPSDLRQMMTAINSMVEERVEIAKTTRVTYKEEKAWLANLLKSIRRKEAVMVVAEIDGVYAGGCQVIRDNFDVSRHVGMLGVGLTKQARGIGIGTRLVELCLSESKRIGIKLVKLYVFDTNKSGRRFYKKLGFKYAGRIKKGVFHNGRYKDDIIMTKRL